MPLLLPVEDFAERHGLLPRGERVLVAVSGGPDSVALLHVLLRLGERRGFKLHGAHVDHGLRESSGADAVFVRSLCEAWGVDASVVKVDVRGARGGGESVQQAARRLRLGALRRIAADIGARRIALGHHLDDQAETVLLRLLRGAGTTGLAGMRPSRGPFIRPLLGVRRTAIEEYVQEHRLNVLHDESNLSTAYLRNRLRLELMPLLQARYNPNVVEALARTAEVVQADDALLRSLAEEVYESVRLEPGHLVEAGPNSETEPRIEAGLGSEAASHAKPRGPQRSAERDPGLGSDPGPVALRAEELAQQPEALQRRVVRRALRDAGADLRLVTNDHTRAVMALLADAEAGALKVPGNIRVERDGPMLLVGAGAEAEIGGSFGRTPAVILSEPPVEGPLTFPGRTVVAPGVAFVLIPAAVDLGSEDICSADLYFDGADSGRTDSDGTDFDGADSDGVNSDGADTDDGDSAGGHADLGPWTEARVLAGVTLDLDSLRPPLFVRVRRPGDRMRPLGLGGSKKLQDIFVDDRVPRRVRDRVPLLLDQEGIVWIPGLRVDERAAPGPDSRNILHVRVESL